MKKQVDISIVIPLYNEEDNIVKLYEELDSVLSGIPFSYEIIFINDGSSDQTDTLAQELSKQNSNVMLISFRKNFGQTAAMSAGFDHSSGNIIITMDGDLQNDPADIPELLAIIDSGFDVAAGWRHKREDSFFSRRLPSIIANKMISVITGVHLHDYGCTLKAFRKEVTDNINLYGEMHRFIPAIASAMGVSIAEVKVNHRARIHGSSKYGISRTYRVILDLITVKFLLSYSNRPIHIFGLVGIASFSLGSIMGVFLILQRQLYGMPLADRPMFLLAIFFLFMGIQFVTFGLMSELQIRTYHESQKKPTYHIKNITKND